MQQVSPRDRTRIAREDFFDEWRFTPRMSLVHSEKERVRMELEVGAILEGKVTGITKFGAFVQLPGGVSGLVHISEIANAYVSDVNDYLHLGDIVKVKVISINEAGKINLSIKQTLPAPARSERSPRPAQNVSRAPVQPRGTNPDHIPAGAGELHGPSSDASFEDKLKHFMQESDSKMSGNKLYADRKNSGRRRK